MVLLTSVCPPSEGIHLQQADITAVWNSEGLGPGTLLIAETRVSWFNVSGMGFCLDYQSISLHAISRDLTSYPKEHLYVMVNSKLKANGEKENIIEDADDQSESSDEDCNDDSTSQVTEIRFVPSDEASLEAMFTALTDCQALHPDPDESDSDLEGDEYDVEEAESEQIDPPTFYNFEEGLSHLTLEGQATLERLEGMLAQSAPQPRCCMGGVDTKDSLPCKDGTERPLCAPK
ncbi:methylosome subunit pICln [Hypomesus transpacificus]|uniref:methylosome subunit pICln n=1 Tax=Hypomesus transpacificus TaxID=137520 RepID=UPI001F081D42|nr:methylosome subunit pICln [Hypomesus transpacificus]